MVNSTWEIELKKNRRSLSVATNRALGRRLDYDGSERDVTYNRAQVRHLLENLRNAKYATHV